MELPLLILIALSLMLFIDSCMSKYKLTNMNDSFVHGMWENEDKEIYLYISEDKDKNGYNLGYIVKDTSCNEPIKIKYKATENKIIFKEVEGTNYISNGEEAEFDMKKGTMKINDIILYKDSKFSDI